MAKSLMKQLLFKLKVIYYDNDDADDDDDDADDDDADDDDDDHGKTNHLQSQNMSVNLETNTLKYIYHGCVSNTMITKNEDSVHPCYDTL